MLISLQTWLACVTHENFSLWPVVNGDQLTINMTRKGHSPAVLRLKGIEYRKGALKPISKNYKNLKIGSIPRPLIHEILDTTGHITVSVWTNDIDHSGAFYISSVQKDTIVPPYTIVPPPCQLIPIKEELDVRMKYLDTDGWRYLAGSPSKGKVMCFKSPFKHAGSVWTIRVRNNSNLIFEAQGGRQPNRLNGRTAGVNRDVTLVSDSPGQGIYWEYMESNCSCNSYKLGSQGGTEYKWLKVIGPGKFKLVRNADQATCIFFEKS